MLKFAFLLAVALMVTGCLQEPNLDLNIQNTPGLTFVFDGRSYASEFEVLQLPKPNPPNKVNPFAFNGEAIWKISTTTPIKGSDWPRIAYGEAPQQFAQTVPENGAPPKLTEDKLYVGRVTGGKDAQTTVFFEIRNGKAVNVSDKLMH
jgi:hypothetical protein